MNLKCVDICCGLAWGDEAKGKIVSELAKSGKYDMICRCIYTYHIISFIYIHIYVSYDLDIHIIATEGCPLL